MKMKGEAMARPQRSRRIYTFPDYWSFGPEEEAGEDVILALDEYETIRLIDLEKMTQEECADQMDIARTTVTSIYDRARQKLADSLVNGKRLVLSGGSYTLREEANLYGNKIDKKGKHIMRIAVPFENGNVFQHFGHSEQIKLYDVENGNIISEKVADTNGSGHGALAGFLVSCEADALICGGIGGGAKSAISEAGIRLYAGVSGSADEAVRALLDGTLEFTEDVTCNHHGHDHGEGHACGHHGHDHGEGHSCGHHGHDHGEGHACGHHGHDHGTCGEGSCESHGCGHGKCGGNC